MSIIETTPITLVKQMKTTGVGLCVQVFEMPDKQTQKAFVKKARDYALRYKRKNSVKACLIICEHNQVTLGVRVETS